MNNNIQTIILAGWEWNRMKSVTLELGLPKHLLPLWNGETPATRLIRQVNTFSNKIYCVINAWEKQLYEKKVDLNKFPNLEFVEKEKKWKAFVFDLQSVIDKTSEDAKIVISTGDLIFDDSNIQKLSQKIKKIKRLWIISDFKLFLKKFELVARFIVSDKKILKDFVDQQINPEDTIEFINFLLSKLRFLELKSIDTLMNLNTAEDYLRSIYLFKDE